MASRSEQLAAYRYLGRRLVSALMSGEQHPVDSPGRRVWLALFVSAVLATGLFAALSLSVAAHSSPEPSSSWRYEGAYVIERETGSRFVVFDGRLHPVLNYASVRLIAGRPDILPEYVSRAEFVDVPRGPQLGIPGAPDFVPDSAALLGPADFEPDRPFTVPAGRGALVRTGSAWYLVTDTGMKFPLVRGAGGDALTAMGYARIAPLEVPESKLNLIPTGPALDPAIAREPLAGG